MVIELTVILKDSERTYKQKFLCYQTFELSDSDPYLLECIREAKDNFNAAPEDIIINAKLVL